MSDSTTDRKKSEMYDPFAPRVNGKRFEQILSVRESKAHAAMKKPIASAYSLSILTDYEPLVDDMIKKFIDRIEEEFNARKDKVCDMALWLRLCESCW